MQKAFEGLEPKTLWSYFDAITQIPRCSGKEERILAYLVGIAEKRGLTVRRDKVGNVVIVVPPTRAAIPSMPLRARPARPVPQSTKIRRTKMKTTNQRMIFRFLN